MRTNWILLACAGFVGLGAAACRDTGTGTVPTKDMTGILPVDMTVIPMPDLLGADLAGLDFSMPDLAGKVYVMSSIASMRQGKSGPYEIDNVVSITNSIGTATVSLNLQDAGGGDYSAIQVKCSSGSAAHPCAKTTAQYMALKTAVAGHSYTVQGTYIKSGTSHIEEFYVDSVVDNGNATAPKPVTLQLADIERSAMLIPKWFQKVNVTLAEALNAYDLSPVEYIYSGSSPPCTVVFGFGVIPASVGAPAPAGCNGMMNPAGVAMPSAKEVMITTNYFGTGFTATSDCAYHCTDAQKNPSPHFQVTPAMKVASGTTISGILTFENMFNTMDYYQQFGPTTDAEFPIK